MAVAVSKLPPGFELEAQGAPPGLPPGFELEGGLPPGFELAGPDPREGAPPTVPPGGIGKSKPPAPGILPEAITRPINDVVGLVKPLMDVSSGPGRTGSAWQNANDRVKDTLNFAASMPFSALRLPTPGQMIEGVSGLSGARQSEDSFVENNPAVIQALGAMGEVAPGFTRGLGMGAPRTEFAPRVKPYTVADQARDIGVDLSRSTTGGPAARGAGAVAKDIPFTYVNNPMLTAAERAKGQLGEAKRGVIEDASSGRYPAEGSAESGLADWLRNGRQGEPPPPGAPPPAPRPAALEAPAPYIEAKGEVAGPIKIVTPDQGMEITAVPQVVELSSLRRSAGEYQPRDRARAEYGQEVRERAARLDPEQLKPGRVSDSGAPIALEDGTIISGNGRVMSIAEVYDNPALAERAAAYKASLGPAAQDMKQPVLIMRAQDLPADQAAKFADLSNRGRIATMSATERAARDAKALGPEGVALYRGGEFDAPQNADFLRAFTSKAVTGSERASFSKEGQLTQEGIARMRGAVLASAYDDAATLSKMLESADDNIRNLTGALADAAPGFAALKADIKAGTVMAELDAAPQVTEAVKLIADLRNRGTTPQRFFDQIDAFDTTDPIVKEWVRAFYNEDLSRPISRQKMAEVLKAYSEEARKHQPGGLFEDTTTGADVLAVARKAGQDGIRSESAGTGNLGLEAPRDGAGYGARGGAAQRPATNEVSASPVSGSRQAWERPAAEVGDTSTGAPGNALTQSGSFKDAPPLEKVGYAGPITPEGAAHAARRARLSAALDIPSGKLTGARVVERLVDLAREDNIQAIIRTRSVLGPDAWGDVLSGVIYRMLTDAEGPTAVYSSLSHNTINALFDGKMRQGLDNVMNVSPLVEKQAARAVPSKIGRGAAKAEKIYRHGLGYTGTVALMLDPLALIHFLTTKGAIKGGLYGFARYMSKPASAPMVGRWFRSAFDYAKDSSPANAKALALTSRNISHMIAQDSGGDERKISDDLVAAVEGAN